MDQFQNLYEQLKEQKYPLLYPFKFIGPPEKVNQLKKLLKDAELSQKPSRNGKYISLTAKAMMMDPESIIELYREAAKIKGVISL